MKIKRLWRLYRGFALSIALLVFSVVGILVGIIPVVKASLGSLSAMQKLDERTKVLAQKQRFLDSLDELTVRQNLNVLLSAVPSDKSLPSILSTMDSVVSQSGLSAIDLTITNPGSLATEAATRKTSEEKQIGSSLQPFSVTLEGSVASLGNFLQKVISVRRLLRVRSFSAVLTKSGNGQIHAELDAFYSQLPKTIGSVDQPISPVTSEDDALITKIASYPFFSQGLSVNPTTGPPGRTNPFPQ